MSETKWQRLTYMHGLPLHGQRRVTESPEHKEVSHRAASEGMVLLKNEQKVLPLQKHCKVALFGKAQADYVKGGGGSGDVTVSSVVSILEGLRQKEQEGKVQLFKDTSDYYESYVHSCYQSGAKPGMLKEPTIEEELVKQARAFTDTALLTISRYSSESYDRTGSLYDGDYFLSHEEEDLIKWVTTTFPTTMVVLNVGGIMDTSWFYAEPKIQGALLAGQAGMLGGLAVADILVGDTNPSGHLASTMALDFSAYPSSENFNESESYVEYEEDIYVGYRYFETLPDAKKKVCYPFGYGLSYTTFEVKKSVATVKDGMIVVSAEIKNTGKTKGKAVIQVYAEAPQGKLGKAKRVLVSFAKSRELDADEKQTLELSFSFSAFASYDDEGLVSKASYVLEAGEYCFYIGQDVRSTKIIQFQNMDDDKKQWNIKNGNNLYFNEDVVLKQLTTRCAPRQLKRRLTAEGIYRETVNNETSNSHFNDVVFPSDGTYPRESPWTIPYSAWKKPEGPQFIEVFEGKLSLDDFIATLTDEEKIHMLCGQPNRGVADTFGMGNLPHKGVPNVMTADGPAGLRIKERVGVTTTAFPCASLLACTWDVDLLKEVGRCAAEEVLENGIGIWLAPAINIQRSPLCGRNFEYYSEDPLLAGQLAASLIRGIQELGVAASLKHFACNNKETNRKESDSRLSERALREIYIKAFEICVKEADPWTIMSSYNLINGERASCNKDLLTHILRDEWGFEGLVTTDWYTHGEQWREINAGNDVKMGSGTPEYTLKMLQAGELDREALDRSVRKVLEMILKLA